MHQPIQLLILPQSKFYIETFEGLYIGFGGEKENIPAALNNLPNIEKYEGNVQEFVAFLMQGPILPEYLAWWALGQVRNNWSAIISKPAMLPLDAYEWMKNEIDPLFDNARSLVGPTAGAIQFNTPPAISHMIEVGMFRKNEHIQLKTICTVMNYTELESKK